jgi:hypothetical protein
MERRAAARAQSRLFVQTIRILLSMRSKIATDLERRRSERLAEMSPAERVAMAERLGEEAVASYMMAHAVDRATAIAQIKATHRLGRRFSASAAD